MSIAIEGLRILRTRYFVEVKTRVKAPILMASKMPTSQRNRPTKKPSSRRFGAEPQNKPSERHPEPDASDYFSSRPKITRSTSYTTPLPLGDRSQLTRESDLLTEENLQSFLSDLEKHTSAPPSVKEHRGHMRKKSSKKSDKKQDPDSHPLNLPPDELRRLSAAMAREEARNSTPMNLDDEDPMTNGISEPPTPSQDAPGAFPDAEVNGTSDHDEKSPTPPPHRTPSPKVDPEACKAAGNKFFKAKDYERAIQEYTKGKSVDPRSCAIANTWNSR